MAKYANQFIDKFKYLTTASTSVKDLRVQITSILNRMLPSRVLSKANIFNMAIDVSQDLSNMIMLHVEDSLIEQNILIAQKDISVRGLATLSGHNATRPISSTGIVKLTFNSTIQLQSPVLFFENVIFRCADNNLLYRSISKIQSISSNTPVVYLNLIEGSVVVNQYVAIGDKLETIHLDDNSAIEQSNIEIEVNGIIWSLADSLYDMSVGDKKYVVKNGISNQVDITFGDGIHGEQLSNGDIIRITHLITAGEAGNVPLTAKWTLVSGIYDSEGNAIDVASNVSIIVDQGFELGSNGESIDVTRQIAGWSSRSMTFTRPENIKAYLSRLSILSYINVWTDTDDNIFNMMMLPNIQQKLSSYSTYLDLPISEFSLSDKQKSSILDYMNTSGKQTTSTELVIHDPLFEKYVMFVFINATIVDKASMKEQIHSAIAKIWASSTVLDSALSNESGNISQTELLEAIWSIDNIHQANIDIVSERNELARINGYYDDVVTSYVGSVKKLTTKRILVESSTNPNIGFDDLGDIIKINYKSIPLLRGGFNRFNPSDDNVLLTKPIYVFHQTINGFEEL